MSKIKEQFCKRISDALSEITKDGRFVKRTQNSKGIFIHDSHRSQFVKALAEIILNEKEVLDDVSFHDLESILFNALRMTQNKSNMQDRASAAAKLILERRQANKS